MYVQKRYITTIFHFSRYSQKNIYGNTVPESTVPETLLTVKVIEEPEGRDALTVRGSTRATS